MGPVFMGAVLLFSPYLWISMHWVFDIHNFIYGRYPNTEHNTGYPLCEL